MKQAVRRNIARFPKDFMFELSQEEFDSLRSQFVILKNNDTNNLRSQTASSKKTNSLRSQIATLETGRGKHSKYLPFAFTEQGVAMLASVLNNPKAIQINIQIVRAFVFMRQYALTHKDLTEKIKELESKYNKKFNDVHEAINYLMNKDKQVIEQKGRKRIGYK